MERKLVAILAGDVVGYSRLMNAHESETVENLQACFEYIRECIDDYGGRPFNSAGDSLLSEFGSVVDAVRCALEVQDFLTEVNADMALDRQLLMRFGIHLGDVVVNGENYLGDGVNIAARLEGLAEPGGICISDSVHQNVVGKIDAGFEDMGEPELKNIERPVRVYRLKTNGHLGLSAATASGKQIADVSNAPAIAILPFSNMGDDPRDEYFVDGLTEDLITALSAWRSFPVIARNSTFAYKGRSPDIRKAAAELNARYVLEGSVRKSADRVRVNAQLIDAATGHHIWAEKFDRQIEDIFEVQDEITQYLAAIVEPELGKTEQRRVVPQRSASLRAWELFQRGMAFLDQWTQDGNNLARDMFEKALELDPVYAQALTGLAYTHHRDLWFGYSESRQDTIKAQIDTAKRAVALDDGDSQAHCMLGFGYLWSRNYARAIAEGERAVELNPSNFVALSQLGLSLCYAGEPIAGIPYFERALKINPRNPRNHFVLSCLARARLNARDPQASASAARKALTHKADFPLALLILASSEGHLGNKGDAAEALEECERLQPGFAVEWALTPMYKDPADDLFFLEGLREAGLDAGGMIE